MGRKKIAYAVVRGHNPGIYSTWDECKQQVDRYPAALYKGFGTLQEAEKWFNGEFSGHAPALAQVPLTGATADADVENEGSQAMSPHLGEICSDLTDDDICINSDGEAPSAPSSQSEPLSQTSTSSAKQWWKSFGQSSKPAAVQGGGRVSARGRPSSHRAEPYRSSRAHTNTYPVQPSPSTPPRRPNRGLADGKSPGSTNPRSPLFIPETPPRSFPSHPMSVAGGAPLLVPKPEVELMDEDFAATQSAAPFLNQSLASDTPRSAQPASHTVTIPGDGSHASVKRESGQPQNIDQSTAPSGAEPKCHWLSGQAADGDAEVLGAMPAAEPLPDLHPEQRQVLDDVLNGENVMVSGVGGTGKSFLLKCIIKCLIRKHGADKVGIMAPTGIAAESLGGCSIHSFFGIGVPRIRKDFQKMWSERIRRRVRDLEVVVIDEVSMCSGELFELLSVMLQEIRGSSKVFGGIQLVLSGDFLQLPPIEETNVIPLLAAKEKEGDGAFRYTSRGAGDSSEAIRAWNKDLISNTANHPFGNRGFAFESQAWQDADIKYRELTHVWRQEDERFVRALQQVRLGNVTPAVQSLLQGCFRMLPAREDGIESTKLYCRTVQVDGENIRKLALIPEPEVTLTAIDDVVYYDDEERARDSLRQHSFFQQCRAGRQVRLKVGAQVMLLRNLEQGGGPGARYLVNGSRGVVIGFADVDAEVRRMARGTGTAHIEHCKEAVLEMNRVVPIVRFNNGLERFMFPEAFEMTITNVGTCFRVQAPLMLAYAVTIHKSQGMTLDFVTTDLGSPFADGQAYVALSRVRSLEGLQLTAFNPRKVTASAKAIEFYYAVRIGREVESRWHWSDARRNNRVSGQ